MSLAEIYVDPEFTIGERIAKARRDRGWDQQQLADAVGVSRPLVSKWERSKSLPDVVQAMEICRHTHKRLVWLLNADPVIRCSSDSTPLSSVNAVLGQLEIPYDDQPLSGPVGVVPAVST